MTVTFRKAAAVFVLLFLFSIVYGETACALAGGAPYRIVLEAFPGGDITVHSERAGVIRLGKVLSVPSSTRWPAFTASRWGNPGTVVATAVNALHILVDIEKGRGRTVSILPKETFAPASGETAFFLTDIPPGRGIFGAWAPTVGSRVIWRKAGNHPGEKTTSIQAFQSFEILVTPEETPYYVEIENRPGGRITAWTGSGPIVLGRVARPVAGCGRFGGTQFQEVGRIRANHPGVIDVSTSREGFVGGFQILPLEHAESPEMSSAWKLSQWLVAAPKPGGFVGRKPLFSSGFVPGPSKEEKLWDVWSTYGRRSLVLARILGGPWQWMPEATGRNDTALKDITHLRLYFPFTEEPQKAAGSD